MAFGDSHSWPFEQQQPAITPTISEFDLFTIEQVTGMCQRSKAAVEADVAAGKFPAPIKIGGSNRWIRQELIDFLMRKVVERNQRVAAAQEKRAKLAK
jgi:predicted DNA-binding transcriptional regulator AlpA